MSRPTTTDRPLPVDQGIRDEIRTSLDENLCVEAAAGTGKTSVLVDRIVEVLRQGRASIDEIAVITFTEKAAAELAARVRDGLEQALAEAERAGEETRKLQEAILGLHRARIETIHAFAANILRERPVEARLDPGFEVLDSLAARLHFDEAYEQWIHELYGAESGEGEPLRRALNRGFDLKQVREAAEIVHRYRDVLPLAPFPAVAVPDVELFAQQVADWCAELKGFQACCVDDEDGGYLQIPAILQFCNELEEAGGDRERLERLVLTRAPASKQKGSQGSFDDAEDCRRMKAIFKELSVGLEQIQGPLRSQALAEFLPLVEGFVSGYEKRRRAEGRADFDDLLLWSRELLRDDLGVRGYFQERFKCVLVDEFQDTDPVQVELIFYICSESGADGVGPADWQELALRPGALFVVGDPKQSIYRFRGADIGIYDQVKNGALVRGVRELEQNFRSVEGITAWVNRVFDRILVEELGVQPRNIHLVATTTDLPADRSAVMVLHGEETVTSQEKLRMAEAQALAALIKRAVEVEKWHVRDPRSGEVRDARFGDVAVIVPWRTEIQLYEDAFEQARLPYRHEGNRSFFQRQEVKELAACLHAVDDPTNEIEVVTALRSSAFACSDEELFLFKTAGGRFDYRRESPEGHEAVAEALAVLHELYQERRKLSLSELVHRLLQRTRLVEFALTTPLGDQAAGNLLKVVDQARAFAGAEGGGVRRFARWLATGRDPETEEAEASVVEETDDVVRLLTIHRAKGLEFPIVALANSNSRPSYNRNAFPDRSEHRLHIPIQGGFKTPGFEDAWPAERHQIEAERQRMLYVASTRARDHLIIPVVEKEKGGVQGMIKELLPDLPEWDEEKAGTGVDGVYVYDRRLLAVSGAGANGRVSPASEMEVNAALKARTEWIANRDAVFAGASRELSIVTASSLEQWERPSAERSDELEGVRLPRGEATAVGDALHRVMELVDLPAAKNLESLAEAMSLEAGVPDHLDEVIEMARNCLASPTVQRAIASGSYYREVPFTIPADDGGLAVGRIDLLFEDADELRLVDYKTDRVTEADLKNHVEIYGEQGSAYAIGANRSTGLAVGEVVFVFARLGIEINVGSRTTSGPRNAEG